MDVLVLLGIEGEGSKITLALRLLEEGEGEDVDPAGGDSSMDVVFFLFVGVEFGESMITLVLMRKPEDCASSLTVVRCYRGPSPTRMMMIHSEVK